MCLSLKFILFKEKGFCVLCRPVPPFLIIFEMSLGLNPQWYLWVCGLIIRGYCLPVSCLLCKPVLLALIHSMLLTMLHSLMCHYQTSK